MNANLRAPQQGQSARPSFRADRYHTEVTVQGLLSQSVLTSGIIKRQVNPAIVLVVNNTGIVLEQFHAVGLGTPACLPTDNLEQFERKPLFNAAASAATQYGVCLDAIQNGYVGRVIISGVTPAIGDVPGALVLWTDDATGGYRIVNVGAGWNGFVQFANLRGGPGRVTPTGTMTQFIDIDRDNGLVSFCDGTSLTAWPDGHEIYQTSNLPTGDLIIH